MRIWFILNMETHSVLVEDNLSDAVKAKIVGNPKKWKAWRVEGNGLQTHELVAEPKLIKVEKGTFTDGE